MDTTPSNPKSQFERADLNRHTDSSLAAGAPLPIVAVKESE
ncbi:MULTISPECIES: hypothetical protein [Actinomyces]|nr:MULTISPECIES: hypothetical protein [Actinomyces]